MAVYYLDASALVKRYVVESGTTFVVNLTNPGAGNDVCVANITWVELVAAIYRRVRTGTTTAAAASAAEQSLRHEMHQHYIFVSG